MREQAKIKDELVMSVVDALAVAVEVLHDHMPAEVADNARAVLNQACALILELHEAERIALDMVDLQGQLHNRAVSERDHWKANHDAQVSRARVLIERVDMPLERVSAYRMIGELQAELTASREREQTAYMRGWSACLCTGSNLDEQA